MLISYIVELIGTDCWKGVKDGLGGGSEKTAVGFTVLGICV